MAPRADLVRASARAAGLAVCWVVVTLATFAAARILVPDGDYRVPALLATAALAVSVALGLTTFGLWRRVGFTPWREWRARGLFAVPALLVVFPLAGELGPVDARLTVLVLGYALTGFAEEGFFRGILLEVLHPLGPMRSAALSSALFGAVHLSNILIRGSPAVVVAQAVGAACLTLARLCRTATSHRDAGAAGPAAFPDRPVSAAGRTPVDRDRSQVPGILCALLGLGVVLLARKNGLPLPDGAGTDPNVKLPSRCGCRVLRSLGGANPRIDASHSARSRRRPVGKPERLPNKATTDGTAMRHGRRLLDEEPRWLAGGPAGFTRSI